MCWMRFWGIFRIQVSDTRLSARDFMILLWGKARRDARSGCFGGCWLRDA